MGGTGQSERAEFRHLSQPGSPTFDNCRYVGPLAARTLVPMSEETQVDVAVVGGGPAGWRLPWWRAGPGASVV